MVEKRYINISEAKSEPIYRFGCGIPEMNWLYGYSKDYLGHMWGIPVGSLALLSGPEGLGKSRAIISLSKSLCNTGVRVLYCQNEMAEGLFASYINGSGHFKRENLFTTDRTSAKEQVEIALELGVLVMVIDSASMLDEYGTGSERQVKALITVLREFLIKRNGHIILLQHVNKENKARGSRTLSHLVDIHFMAEPKDEESSDFIIKFGKKNRFGRTGSRFNTVWSHLESGVICNSSNREQDNEWRISHGMSRINEIKSSVLDPNRKLSKEEIHRLAMKTVEKFYPQNKKYV